MTTLTTRDLLTFCDACGVRLEADADRGVLCMYGDVPPVLLAEVQAHSRHLLAVLDRVQRMIAHHNSHDRPPLPMVYWPHMVIDPGSCLSCGRVLDHPRAIGRCEFCEVAADLFYRRASRRSCRSPADQQRTTRPEERPMTMLDTMKQWLERAIPTPPALDGPSPPPPDGPAVPAYTDQQAVRLDAVRRDLTDTRARLARDEVRWRTLKAAADRDDAATEQQLADLRPQLLDLRQQVQTLEAEATATEQAVTATAALAVQYAALVEETTARFQPLFDAVARLTPEVVADAYRWSREVDRYAYLLLHQSGDRQFRRSAVDPYTDLRNALTEALRLVEKSRRLRPDTSPDTKTA